MRAYVSGTGSYLPERVVTNEELCSMVEGCSAEWIVEKLGIHERRFASDDQQTSDLAKIAAERALAMARITAADLDAIVCCVGTGDVLAPATSTFLQQKLGATGASFCYDLKAACAGPLTAIYNARAMIEAGLARHVLVAGTYIPSRTAVDFSNRGTAPLFGDGAGAVVISATEENDRGILMSRIHTDGSLAEIIGRFGGGTRDPLSAEMLARGAQYIQMDGRAVWDCATRVLPEVVREVTQAADLRLADIDFVVSHQANKRLLGAVLAELGLSMDKTHTNIERYGNTGPASFLIALDEAVRTERITSGKTVIFLAIGAGMTWGAHVVRW